jgi:hypothetical protein
MIGKVGRGSDVAGLLRYLFGPGRANQHTRPHLVASWDGAHRSLEPPPHAIRPAMRDIGPLAGLLSHPVLASGRAPDKPVWHCSVRTAPGDRWLSDTDWAAIARRVMTATGIAPDDDPDACRWVAVRHADDHIHIVATLVRQDGRTERASNDFYRVGDACRWAEGAYGLTGTAPLDRTVGRQSSRAEHEKGRRTGRREPARATLRRRVRTAAVAATGPDEFLHLLAQAGLQVRPRISELDGETVTGYSVALPDDHDRHGRPVWFGGGKLAADLSWPRLASRWPDTTGTLSGQGTGHVSGDPVRLSATERVTVWRDATRLTTQAATTVRVLSGHDPVGAAAIADAAGDVLAVTANAVEGRRGGPLTDASASFNRAARSLGALRPRIPRPGGAPGQGLRVTARLIALAGRAQRDEMTQVLALVMSLADLADALAALRQAQQRPAQSQAAQEAAHALRDLRLAAQPAKPTSPLGAKATPDVFHSPTSRAGLSTDPRSAGPPPRRAHQR